MQRDTSAFYIQRANHLSIAIDASAQRPDKLIKEFDICLAWLRKYAPSVDIIYEVRCPHNW